MTTRQNVTRPVILNASTRSIELAGMLLMPLGIHPTVDFVFKLLFGDTRNVDLLIHLLNSVLNLEHPIVEATIL